MELVDLLIAEWGVLVMLELVDRVTQELVAQGKTVQQYVNDDHIELELLLMKKVSLDVWIQLLGMMGVIASLVFVGLQMRQSQEIALAAQQTDRMQVFTDIVNAFTEAGIQYGQNFDDGTDQEFTETFNPGINVAHQALWVFENDYLQYSLGLMDENIWEAKLKFMLASFSSCIGRQVFNQRRESLDQRIVELIISVPAANCE